MPSVVTRCGNSSVLCGAYKIHSHMDSDEPHIIKILLTVNLPNQYVSTRIVDLAFSWGYDYGSRFQESSKYFHYADVYIIWHSTGYDNGLFHGFRFLRRHLKWGDTIDQSKLPYCINCIQSQAGKYVEIGKFYRPDTPKPREQIVVIGANGMLKISTQPKNSDI